MSEDKIITFYNKVTERIESLPEIADSSKELINELQDRTLDLASIVYILWCKLDEMKSKDL
jgi:hypothetical protein